MQKLKLKLRTKLKKHEKFNNYIFQSETLYTGAAHVRHKMDLSSMELKNYMRQGKIILELTEDPWDDMGKHVYRCNHCDKDTLHNTKVKSDLVKPTIKEICLECKTVEIIKGEGIYSHVWEN